MDMFTLNPHNISHFGETWGHNMDVYGLREASQKLFGMYLKRGKIVFFRNNVIYCGRPWPAAYININVNTHQFQVLTEPLCRAQAISYLLPNNELGTKYRGFTYSAK